MKNIHILPTDQPSRLYLEYGDGDLCLANNPLPQTSRSNNQHLYVTSDEKPKQNDWCLHDGVVYIMRNHMISRPSYNAKKIILTTDPTLISDGVQSIDNDFLEWFVKNPSCEEVKIEDYGTLYNFRYLILIPQEEPKQEFLLFDKERANTITSEGQKTVRELQNTIQQETLEEAAKEFYPPTTTDLICSPKLVRDAFLAGAKWQAERMYSDLYILRNDLYNKLPTGNVDTFELLKIIKNHIQKLDDLCGNK
jgi:hypothetical protein